MTNDTPTTCAARGRRGEYKTLCAPISFNPAGRTIAPRRAVPYRSARSRSSSNQSSVSSPASSQSSSRKNSSARAEAPHSRHCAGRRASIPFSMYPHSMHSHSPWTGGSCFSGMFIPYKGALRVMPGFKRTRTLRITTHRPRRVSEPLSKMLPDLTALQPRSAEARSIRRKPERGWHYLHFSILPPLVNSGARVVTPRAGLTA